MRTQFRVQKRFRNDDGMARAKYAKKQLQAIGEGGDNLGLSRDLRNRVNEVMQEHHLTELQALEKVRDDISAEASALAARDEDATKLWEQLATLERAIERKNGSPKGNGRAGGSGEKTANVSVPGVAVRKEQSIVVAGGNGHVNGNSRPNLIPKVMFLISSCPILKKFLEGDLQGAIQMIDGLTDAQLETLQGVDAREYILEQLFSDGNREDKNKLLLALVKRGFLKKDTEGTNDLIARAINVDIYLAGEVALHAIKQQIKINPILFNKLLRKINEKGKEKASRDLLGRLLPEVIKQDLFQLRCSSDERTAEQKSPPVKECIGYIFNAIKILSYPDRYTDERFEGEAPILLLSRVHSACEISKLCLENRILHFNVDFFDSVANDLVGLPGRKYEILDLLLAVNRSTDYSVLPNTNRSCIGMCIRNNTFHDPYIADLAIELFELDFSRTAGNGSRIGHNTLCNFIVEFDNYGHNLHSQRLLRIGEKYGFRFGRGMINHICV